MFKSGLRKEIKERVNMMQLPMIVEVSDVAMVVEQELMSSESSQSQSLRKRAEGGKSVWEPQTKTSFWKEWAYLN